MPAGATPRAHATSTSRPGSPPIPRSTCSRTAGQSIDDKIFDFSTLLIDRVTTPKTGFNVTVRFGDHPHNTIPYRFQNSLTGARNFLALAARAQKFNVYLVTRANPTAPIEILGRFNWAADWIVEFAWSVRTGRPTATTRRVDILEGVFVKGAPNPPDASSRIDVARSMPTANRQDDDAVKAIYDRRRAPLLRESRLAAGLPRQFLHLTPPSFALALRMARRVRSAPRCSAGTVAVVVLASADDLLLNDVITIPVLTAVRHGHRGIATAVSLVVPGRCPC